MNWHELEKRRGMNEREEAYVIISPCSALPGRGSYIVNSDQTSFLYLQLRAGFVIGKGSPEIWKQTLPIEL